MPFTLHPSGYAVFWNESAIDNLRHDKGGEKEFGASRSRRGKFFDRCSALYFFHKKLHLWTFTVPQLQKNYKETDLVFTTAFSKLLENYKKQGLIKSYVYVTEAQARGNIHFHLITNAKFIDVQTVNSYWCKLIGQRSKSAVDLEVIDNAGVNKIPAYLAKYMAKAMDGKAYKNGNQVETDKNLKGRIIYARSFNSSRDLAQWKPLRLENHELPVHLEHTRVEKILNVTTLDKTTGELVPRDIIKTEYYFNSMEVIRYFGQAFTNRPEPAPKQVIHEYIPEPV